MKHFSNLFVFSATLRSPVVGQQRSKSLCFVTTFTTCRLSQSSVGLSQFAQYLNLTSRNCGTEDKCEFKFSVYSMLASPQHTSCFFFDTFYAMNIKPAVAIFIFFEAPTWCIHLTAAVHRMWAVQITESSRKFLRFVGCVCTVVSLSLLFCICLFLFCFCDPAVAL